MAQHVPGEDISDSRPARASVLEYVLRTLFKANPPFPAPKQVRVPVSEYG